MKEEVKYIIEKLNLKPHPEGGWFAETYRSVEKARIGIDVRNYCTAIYFLLEKGQFSALHKIESDEMWHFYKGFPLEIFWIDENGNWQTQLLGNDLLKNELPQFSIKSGLWFGSRPAKRSDYSLVGCTVSPGFDFSDFTLAQKESLLKEYPHLSKEIEAFCIR